MTLEHLVRKHPLKCENCNWVGTYEEAAMRFYRKEQIGWGKTSYASKWGSPICAVCGASAWSSKLMPTETDPDSVCDCRDVDVSD